MSTTVSINSVAEYLNEIFEYANNNNNNKTLYFRGQANFDWHLIPSLFREDRFIDNEDIMFYQSSSLLSEEFSADVTAFDKLTRMQHYLIPTRMLDVTTNPLVALYFACCEENCSDGSVWCFDVPKREIKNYDSDCVTMLSNLAKCKKTTIMWELVHQIKQEKDFEEKYMDKTDLNKCFFVNPKKNNERIKSQSGAFIIVGGVTISPHNVIEKKRMTLETSNFKIRINNYAKYKILKELNVLGINKGSIYCDIEYKFKNLVNGL